MGHPQTLQALPDEETIRKIVESFYGKVRLDELLAPTFESRLSGHWDYHLDTMVDFWSSILLTSGRYRGRPLIVHEELGEITPEMWARWLELFGEACRESSSEAVSALVMLRAEQIASHLSRRLANRGTKRRGP